MIVMFLLVYLIMARDEPEWPILMAINLIFMYLTLNDELSKNTDENNR